MIVLLQYVIPAISIHHNVINVRWVCWGGERLCLFNVRSRRTPVGYNLNDTVDQRDDDKDRAKIVERVIEGIQICLRPSRNEPCSAKDAHEQRIHITMPPEDPAQHRLILD